MPYRQRRAFMTLGGARVGKNGLLHQYADELKAIAPSPTTAPLRQDRGTAQPRLARGFGMEPMPDLDGNDKVEAAVQPAAPAMQSPELTHSIIRTCPPTFYQPVGRR